MKDLSDALKKCLNDEEFVKMGVEKWWIIGDNVDLVKNISKRFDDVYHLYSDEFIALLVEWHKFFSFFAVLQCLSNHVLDNSNSLFLLVLIIKIILNILFIIYHGSYA